MTLGRLFNSDLFQFPFISDVWGTASDWVTTIAAIVTLYYIVRTFQSQLIVQKSQVELTKVEVDRFIYENKPIFKLFEFDFSGLLIDENSPNFVFHLQKKGQLDALGLKVFPSKDFYCEILAGGDNIKANEEITLMFFLKNRMRIDDLRFNAFILFKDRYGNNYRQVLNAFPTSDNVMDSTISELSINDRFGEIADMDDNV